MTMEKCDKYHLPHQFNKKHLNTIEMFQGGMNHQHTNLHEICKLKAKENVLLKPKVDTQEE
jgi:hypothetical protein